MKLIDNLKSSLLLLAFFIVGCRDSAPQKHTLQGVALGTTFNIIYLSTNNDVTYPQVDSLLNAFEKSCSIFDSTSLLSRVNRYETDSIDSNIATCIEIASNISEQTKGMYDITVAPLVEAYGFAEQHGTNHPNIDSIMHFIGYKQLSVDGDKIIRPKGVQIDLNSIAKGYSVDLVSRFIESKGIENYLVEIGGEIYTKGLNDKGEEWRIGIDKPTDGNYSPGKDIQTVISISNKALASSGNYRRFRYDEDGNRINHTLNPLTGKSATTTLLSATIIAPNCAIADGYATAMMSLGTKKAIEFLKNHSDLSAYLVYSSADTLAVYQQ